MVDFPDPLSPTITVIGFVSLSLKSGLLRIGTEKGYWLQFMDDVFLYFISFRNGGLLKVLVLDITQVNPFLRLAIAKNVRRALCSRKAAAWAINLWVTGPGRAII